MTYETDRALSDLDTLALRERVRGLQQARDECERQFQQKVDELFALRGRIERTREILAVVGHGIGPDDAERLVRDLLAITKPPPSINASLDSARRADLDAKVDSVIARIKDEGRWIEQADLPAALADHREGEDGT